MIVKGKLLMDQDGDSVAMADPGPIPFVEDDYYALDIIKNYLKS